MSWSKLRVILHHLENALLVVLFIVVIGAANTQIVLRNLFESSISWIDPFLRITILWLALMGAMVATRERVHIAIDLFLRYLPYRWRIWIERLIHLISALVCGIVAYFSARLVWMEFSDATLAFASVPLWLCEGILPIAFSVMALRFLLQAFASSREMLDKDVLKQAAQEKAVT
ncbi:MAG: TRAP transporter small permease [Pseudomonadota bacterium]